jgi:glucose dehydrogenase
VYLADAVAHEPRAGNEYVLDRHRGQGSRRFTRSPPWVPRAGGRASAPAPGW